MKNLTFALTFILALSACSKPNQEISTEITKKIESNNSDPIDLRQIGPESWERLCIIGPYASNDTAEKIIGFKWNVNDLSSIGSNDSINLVVFIKNNQVVALTEHPRNKGDFSNLNPSCLTRDTAIFKRETDSTGWVKLVHEP